MCEHEWITTRAVYRTSTTDGYKNHEINRRVCINCLKTKDEIELEQQLSAANARMKELEKSNKKWSIVVDDLKQLSEKDNQRAEQAEAQAAAMREAIQDIIICAESEDNRLLLRPRINCVLIHALKKSAEPAAGSALLARMERMREALLNIVGFDRTAPEDGGDFGWNQCAEAAAIIAKSALDGGNDA